MSKSTPQGLLTVEVVGGPAKGATRVHDAGPAQPYTQAQLLSALAPVLRDMGLHREDVLPCLHEIHVTLRCIPRNHKPEITLTAEATPAPATPAPASTPKKPKG